MNCMSFSSDGKLLATSCDDENVYTWNFSAILQDAGFDDFLLDQHDKSVLAVCDTFINNSHCTRDSNLCIRDRCYTTSCPSANQSFASSTPWFFRRFVKSCSLFCTTRWSQFVIPIPHFSLGSKHAPWEK
ncbi:hypothetical protein BDR03DRAFT_938474 [Suillus americanus]|nr:hypothetical protein BDR03DRAFT_938474 [Suillus americanus]